MDREQEMAIRRFVENLGMPDSNEFEVSTEKVKSTENVEKVENAETVEAVETVETVETVEDIEEAVSAAEEEAVVEAVAVEGEDVDLISEESESPKTNEVAKECEAAKKGVKPAKATKSEVVTKKDMIKKREKRAKKKMKQKNFKATLSKMGADISCRIKNIKATLGCAVDNVKLDIKATRDRDPAARSDLEVLLLSSGVHAMFAYRIAHALHLKEKYMAARAISQLARHFTGIEIHPGATIGKGLMIDHGMGVVIGETAEIGDNCTIYQGVTLGGTGKDVGKRHPTLGNNVMVGAGAKVLGPFKIGDNTKIAANAVVLEEIPEDCTAVGIPAKIVKREGVRVDDMDQIHIPDPVAQEIKRLQVKLSELESELEYIKTQKSNETDRKTRR